MIMSHIQEFTRLWWFHISHHQLKLMFSNSFTKELRKCSAINIFPSSKIWHPRTLSDDSIAIHIQEYLLPTLSYVPFIIKSRTLFLLVNILSDLYFCTHLQMAMWLVNFLILDDSAFVAFLKIYIKKIQT